jgi:hypothetical protein
VAEDSAKTWWNGLTQQEKLEIVQQMHSLLMRGAERIGWNLSCDQLGPETQQGPLKTYYDVRIAPKQ